MPQVLARLIPPTIALFDFIRICKPRPREFHPSDMEEISKMILFETPYNAAKMLCEMYDATITFEEIDESGGSFHVRIDGQLAFTVWRTDEQSPNGV